MSEYLKPQSPLYHKEKDAYFYPLTTADQIIMEDGNRLNTVFKSTVRKSVTLLADNWSADAPYTQIITVTDVNFDDLNVDIHVTYTGNKESDLELNKGYSCVSYVKKDGNSITFSCLKDKPTIDMPVEIVGTSCDNIATIEESSSDPILQDKNVTPLTNPQSIVADEGFDGLRVVNVEGDADLIATNIKKGVNIFGVDGSYEGGIELNFDVVAYDSEEILLAATPSENTIGVVTTTPISSWIFGSTEPTGSADMVWFKTGTSSAIEFNTLKNNTIYVYPLSAKQYISSTWVDKTVKIYQNGKWLNWNKYLFDNSNKYTNLTGGWSKSNYTFGSNFDHAANSLVTIGKKIICKAHNGTQVDTSGACGTVNKVDITGFTHLRVKGNADGIKGYTSNIKLYVGVNTTKEIDLSPTAKISLTTDGNFDKTLKLPTSSTSYYVFVAACCYVGQNADFTATLTVEEISLENQVVST